MDILQRKDIRVDVVLDEDNPCSILIPRFSFSEGMEGFRSQATVYLDGKPWKVTFQLHDGKKDPGKAEIKRQVTAAKEASARKQLRDDILDTLVAAGVMNKPKVVHKPTT